MMDLEPYQPPVAPVTNQRMPQRFRYAPLVVWWIGFALQFVLFAGFMQSWKSNWVFFNSHSDSLKLLVFSCPIVASGLISILAILLMMKHLTFATRMKLAVGSMVLFGMTWFGFGIYLLSTMYSRMGN